MEIIKFIKILFSYYKGKYDPSYYDVSTLSKKEKYDMLLSFVINRIDFILHLFLSPFVYPIYYVFKNKLNNKLYKYYIKHYDDITLDMFEIKLNESLRYGTIANRNIMLHVIQNALNNVERFLWYSGDIIDVNNTGNCPCDYKKNIKSMFIRRWFYSAIRNPFYNRVWCKYIRGPIRDIDEIFDNRCDVETSNYGTGNHRLGMRFRIYTDIYNNHYFYYEHTYKKHNNYKTHYSGVVGISDVTSIRNRMLFVWYEHSYRQSKLV